MLRGPLHNAGPDGLCDACGEPFPCPTGLAIYEAVKRELAHPTLPPETSVADIVTLVAPPVRWEDLEDRDDRCPKCLHWWVSHGVPTEEDYGCYGSSWLEAERAGHQCGCTFAEGNTVTPRQVRIWHDGTSNPTPPWARA